MTEIEPAIIKPKAAQTLYEVAIRYAIFATPFIFLTFGIYFRLLPGRWIDALQLILATIFLVLGLPLSIACRLDQISLRLGGSFAPEEVLILSLLVAYINLVLLVTLKRIIFGRLKRPRDEAK